MPILPQELDEPRLAQHPGHVVGSVLDDDQAVYAAAEDFHGSGEVGGVCKSDKWLFRPQVLGIAKGNLLATLCSLCEVLEKGELLRGWVETSRREEQVLIEILEVEGPGGGFVTGLIPNQEHAQTRVDEKLKKAH